MIAQSLLSPSGPIPIRFSQPSQRRFLKTGNSDKHQDTKSCDEMAFVPALQLRLGHAGTQFTSRFVQSQTSVRPVVSHVKSRSSSAPRMVANAEAESKAPAFSCKGMTVDEFFEKSVGEWSSQRSSHNLAWAQFEAITSDITITKKTANDDEVVSLCRQHEIAVEETDVSIAMSWEGESDWDEDEVMEGTAVMSVVKDGPANGRLLRSVGYAETIPAVGKWEMTEDGVFVLHTFYEAAAAEERIWFATPNLRMRVSLIRTSSGNGVVTASFSTEIRKLRP